MLSSSVTVIHHTAGELHIAVLHHTVVDVELYTQCYIVHHPATTDADTKIQDLGAVTESAGAGLLCGCAEYFLWVY